MTTSNGLTQTATVKNVFPWKTVGGYDFYEVLSAMQKTLRRGLEKEALFWATELSLSNYAPHAWTRFLIIASEDVGMADPYVCVQIRSLHEAWKEKTKTMLDYSLSMPC